MSLVDDIVNSQKISGGLAMIVGRMQETDKASLKIIFKSSAGLQRQGDQVLSLQGTPIAGVQVRSSIGAAIYTADASLEGIKNLVDDRRIVSVAGSQRGPHA